MDAEPKVSPPLPKPTGPTGPPPLPPLAGVAPVPPGPPPQQGMEAAQAVFDTVVGPNVRLRDNLIQLGCVVVGAVIGAGCGWFFFGRKGGEAAPATALMGGVAGVIAALLLSGLVIGIVRGIQAGLRRRGRG